MCSPELDATRKKSLPYFKMVDRYNFDGLSEETWKMSDILAQLENGENPDNTKILPAEA